jgi:PAS domain S-box-containing protein
LINFGNRDITEIMPVLYILKKPLFPMDDHTLKAILKDAKFGYAIHEITVDKAGKITGITFIGINNTLLNLTGLTENDVLGKSPEEVLPRIPKTRIDLTDLYKIENPESENLNFEVHCIDQAKWFDVQASFPEKKYYLLIFTEVSHEHLIAEAARELSEFTPENINYQRFTDIIRDISGASYVVLNKFDKNGKDFTSIALSGISKNIEKAAATIGFHFTGKRWSYDPVRERKIRDNKITCFSSLSDLTGQVIPEKLLNTLLKTFRVGEAVIVKTTKDNVSIGDFTLIFDRNKHLKNRAIVESFADLTGITLSRIDAEKSLHESEVLYRRVTENISDAVFLTDLELNLTFVGPTIEKIMGEPAGKYIRRSLAQKYPPGALSKLLAVFREELTREEKPGMDPNRSIIIESEHYKCDGSIINVSMGVSFLRDNNKKPIGILGTIRDISEKIRNEKALLESELRMRTYVRNAPYGVLVFDSTGQLKVVNPAASAHLGFSQDDLLKKNISDILYYEDITGGKRDLGNLLKEGTYYYNHIFKHKNGEKRILSLAITKITDNDFLCFCHDITEQFRTEELSRFQSEILKNTADGIMAVKVSDSEIVYTNPKFDAMLGYDPGELIGKHIGIISSPINKCHEKLNEEINVALEEIGYWNGEVCDLKKDSQIIWCSANVSTFKHPSYGEIWIHVHTDIHEKKKAEEKLRKSEQTARTLLNASESLEMLIKKDFILIDINELGSEWLGHKAEELIGSNILDFVPADNQNKRIQRIRSAVINGEHIIFEDERNDRVFSNRIDPIKDEKGNVFRFAIKVTDITHNKRLLNELITAKEKAEESDRLKSAFLANISHEIRTPMNGILGFASLLKEPTLSGQELQEYINIIEKSGSRMLNLINDLIDISKIESGQMEMNYSLTDINEQMAFLFNFFKPEAKLKGLQLSVYCPLPSKKAIVTTDKEKLYAVMTNLIKNAIKFTSKGMVEFGYQTKTGFFEFFVKDTGKGIAAKSQNNIFDHFVQVDSSLSSGFEGAGLGLAISKAYVELLGGGIKVDSQPGIGSAFCFTLPADININGLKTINTNELITGKHKTDPKTILIAEDDEVSIIYLKSILKSFCPDPIIAKTGEEAVELCLANTNIDLVLMDIKMTGMDGFSAAKKIREVFPRLPIIAQSAYVIDSDIIKYKDVFYDYVTKPVNAEELKLKIRLIL